MSVDFPIYRPRRTRATGNLRAMIRETEVSVKDLIYPIFVVPGTNVKHEIESLRKIGAEVNVVTAYETVADCENKDELLAALEEGSASVVTFTSSSTVTNLLKVLGDKAELLSKVALAAIGPITSETLQKHGFAPTIEAEKYTIDGLVKAIRNYYNK